MTQRALVMGHGRMGQFHAKVLRDLGYLVTTVDPRDDSGARWRGIPPGMYFEAGVVAVPISHLAEVAVDVERVCNAIIIEKPGAATSDEMRELRAHIGLSRPAVGYTERFNPVVRAICAARTVTQRQDLKAVFTRWNDKPSPDPWVDLASHDVDLFNYLNLKSAEYDFKADASERIRRIVLTDPDGAAHSFDLLGHTQSPLHAQWHSFFQPGRPGLASLEDAERVLKEVEEMRRYDRAGAVA